MHKHVPHIKLNIYFLLFGIRQGLSVWKLQHISQRLARPCSLTRGEGREFGSEWDQEGGMVGKGAIPHQQALSPPEVCECASASLGWRRRCAGVRSGEPTVQFSQMFQ